MLLITFFYFSCGQESNKNSFGKFTTAFFNAKMEVKYKDQKFYPTRNGLYRYSSSDSINILIEFSGNRFKLIQSDDSINAIDTSVIFDRIRILKNTLGILHLAGIDSDRRRFVAFIDSNYISHNILCSENQEYCKAKNLSLIHYYVDYKSDSLLLKLYNYDQPIKLNEDWFIY